MQLYQQILDAKAHGRHLLAVLLDPDKIHWDQLHEVIGQIRKSPATHILIGGSHVESDRIDELIAEIKSKCALPVILFPGNPSQISENADGILFLSLISGRNAEFLIGHHVDAAPIIRQHNLETIATGYILIDGGSKTAVATVSNTNPMCRHNIAKAVATAQAGEMLGKKVIYLEAGSGAELAVPLEMIREVSQNIAIPVIVGGGIRTHDAIQNAFNSGADMVVIGTAFEKDSHFFDAL